MKRSVDHARVTVNAGVCGGRPCIRDTRIEIAVILDDLAEGLSIEDMIDSYPQLIREDILAALADADEPTGRRNRMGKRVAHPAWLLEGFL